MRLLMSRKRCIYACLYRVRRFHVCALTRGGYQAAGTQLLDRSHLWSLDPHDWHWRAPEFWHFPEANCCRPRRWARGMVFRQRIGAATDGWIVAIRRQYLRSLWYGTDGRRRWRPVCRRYVHDRVCDRKRDADGRKCTVWRRHVGRGIRTDLRLYQPTDPTGETLHRAWCRDGRWVVWTIRYRAIRVAAAAPAR